MNRLRLIFFLNLFKKKYYRNQEEGGKVANGGYFRLAS